MFKLYNALGLTRFKAKQNIIVEGEAGDTFYIILKGEVGVCVPVNHQEIFEDYFDLFYFMTTNWCDIIEPNDKVSKSIAILIDILTPQNCLQLLGDGRGALL